MSFTYITTPWDHQEKAVDNVMENNLNHYGLFFDMGAGKSKTAVDLYRLSCAREKRWLKCLVITPIVVQQQFGGEFLTHSNIKKHEVSVIDGVTKPDGRVLKSANAKLKLDQLHKKTHVYIVNTDVVRSKKLWAEILVMDFDVLIVDESHLFKTFNSGRTKDLLKFVDKGIKYRFILTGTPVLNNALDLWSQFYILDKNIFGANYYTFLHKYFYDRNAGMPSHCHFPDWHPKDAKYYKSFGLPYENINDSLNKIIYNHAMRVLKSDCLDLPPFTYQVRDVGLGKELQKTYDGMEKDAIAFLESGVKITEENFKDDDLPSNVMVADLAIVKLIRLQQLICGIFTDSEGVVSYIPNDREKDLEEVLRTLTVDKENKIIVWSTFKPTYEVIGNICKKLGLKYCFITGQQSYTEKMDAKDAFNNNPETQVVIANQASAGTGVELTAGNYSVYYSRSFNMGHDEQSEARNYRGGQTRNVTRIDLVARGTIDEKIYKALKTKKKNASDILDVKEFTTKEIKNIFN